MNIREVSFSEAYKEARRFSVMQYYDEIEEFLDKCSEYLGKVKTIVEIGSHLGGNLLLLNRLMDGESDDLMIAVSVDQGYGRIHTEMISEIIKPSGVVSFETNSRSVETIRNVENTLGDRLIDVLFIDADHSYEGSYGDYKAYVDLCSPKSIIGLHDIYWTAGGVIKTWDKLKRSYITHECIRKTIRSEYEPKWETVGRGIGILYRGIS